MGTFVNSYCMPATTFPLSFRGLLPSGLMNLEHTADTPDASITILADIGNLSPLPSHLHPLNSPSCSILSMDVSLCFKASSAPSSTADCAIHCSKRCFSNTYPVSVSCFSVPSGKITLIPLTLLLITSSGNWRFRLATASSEIHSPQWTGVPISE